MSLFSSVVKSMNLNFGEESVKKAEEKDRASETPVSPHRLEGTPSKSTRAFDRTDLKAGYRLALDPKLAGASKIHGAALIYRNDRSKVSFPVLSGFSVFILLMIILSRPSEVKALAGISWQCIISGHDHILAQVLKKRLPCEVYARSHRFLMRVGQAWRHHVVGERGGRAAGSWSLRPFEHAERRGRAS